MLAIQQSYSVSHVDPEVLKITLKPGPVDRAARTVFGDLDSPRISSSMDLDSPESAALTLCSMYGSPPFLNLSSSFSESSEAQRINQQFYSEGKRLKTYDLSQPPDFSHRADVEKVEAKAKRLEDFIRHTEENRIAESPIRKNLLWEVKVAFLGCLLKLKDPRAISLYDELLKTEPKDRKSDEVEIVMAMAAAKFCVSVDFNRAYQEVVGRVKNLRPLHISRCSVVEEIFEELKYNSGGKLYVSPLFHITTPGDISSQLPFEQSVYEWMRAQLS